MDSVMGRFSTQHPGVVMDVVLQTVPKASPGMGPLRAVARAAGGPPRDVANMLVALQRTYEVEVLRAPDASGAWTATFEMDKPPADATARALLRFTDEFGLKIRWVRLEQGAAFIRALVAPPANARDLAEQCRGYLHAFGLDADIDVEVVSEAKIDAWLEEVRRVRH